MSTAALTRPMPRMSEDVLSFSNCRRTFAECLARTERTRRPLFITQNGAVTSVIMNIREYEEYEDELSHSEREALTRDVAISRREFADGKGIPHEQVMKDAEAMIRGWMREEGKRV